VLKRFGERPAQITILAMAWNARAARAREVMDTQEKRTYSSLIKSPYEDNHDSLVR
jgi:hypothetical protein